MGESGQKGASQLGCSEDTQHPGSLTLSSSALSLHMRQRGEATLHLTSPQGAYHMLISQRKTVAAEVSGRAGVHWTCSPSAAHSRSPG